MVPLCMTHKITDIDTKLIKTAPDRVDIYIFTNISSKFPGSRTFKSLEITRRQNLET